MTISYMSQCEAYKQQCETKIQKQMKQRSTNNAG